MTLLINIQINLFFKRKFPIGLTSKFGNLVWPNARAALVLSVSPMFYTGFESLNSNVYNLLLNKPQHYETNTMKNGTNRIKQEH
jgi:hypothetical protein